jgi:hypothetical protein
VNGSLVALLQSISATLAWVSGLILVRFWRETGDRLFMFFGAGFWMMAVSWMLLALINPTGEGRPYVYAIRLLAFVLIVAGMIDKNRAPD